MFGEKTPMEARGSWRILTRSYSFQSEDSFMSFMKFPKIFYVIAPAVLVSGCVESHRQPVVYSDPSSFNRTPMPAYSPPPPAYSTPAPVIVAPTSERPDVRIYAADSAPVVVSPPAPIITYSPAESDLALANSLRQMLSADSSLASAARNVRMSIRDGRVTLTGTTSSERARQLMERAVAGTPGVAAVEDRVQVDLH